MLPIALQRSPTLFNALQRCTGYRLVSTSAFASEPLKRISYPERNTTRSPPIESASSNLVRLGTRPPNGTPLHQIHFFEWNERSRSTNPPTHPSDVNSDAPLCHSPGTHSIIPPRTAIARSLSRSVRTQSSATVSVGALSSTHDTFSDAGLLDLHQVSCFRFLCLCSSTQFLAIQNQFISLLTLKRSNQRPRPRFD